ncbi:hypothetical protein EBN03_30235 [Nocardia stercoris]|uniref:Uncharacterized protein n=2 Tax=Nocardia stercoris TaxID=2483361 RepID=A0A3M2KVU7_9NOCA|nr:hypothetical protein EBN03_30235 [Nocardia stercoris]
MAKKVQLGRVVSPDGRWEFEGSIVRSGAAAFDLDVMWGLERWTYARFHGADTLVLAFESGWEYVGDTTLGGIFHGVLVATLDQRDMWSIADIEMDDREPYEDFVPTDVVWDRSGVMGWLHDGVIELLVLSGPRRHVDPTLPQGIELTEDFDLLRLELRAEGTWHELEFDPVSRLLTARDADGADYFDLAGEYYRRDETEWQPMADVERSGWYFAFAAT